jgi:hypothetical protein
MKKFRYSKQRSLAQSFSIILRKSKKTPLTLRAVLEIISGRGKPLILILLCLPFCQPLQIPGLSTPFGLLIMFVALRIAFGHRLWLPKSLLEKKIPRHTLKKVIARSTWVMQKFTHPRLAWLCNQGVLHVVHGLVLAVLGLFLALPLPIPLTNIIAAWSILIISIGLIEEDGVFIIIGYAIPILSFLAFYFLVFKKVAAIFWS